jgi:hypothetical protein
MAFKDNAIKALDVLFIKVKEVSIVNESFILFYRVRAT